MLVANLQNQLSIRVKLKRNFYAKIIRYAGLLSLPYNLAQNGHKKHFVFVIVTQLYYNLITTIL